MVSILPHGTKLGILFFMPSPSKLESVRHSLAHLLAAAVTELYPGAKPAIGPATDDGFYYDFDLPNSLTEKSLAALEQKMRDILESWQGFDREEVSETEARDFFRENPYKLDLINEITARGEAISLYTSGRFTDLCRGGHVESVREIIASTWKLDRTAGAYWRGDERNKMLTRIYGLAFESKVALEEYLSRRSEAKERDHKKLGRELDLFTFSPLVGSGLPLFTPKGTILRDILDDYVWELRREQGYERVDIPHVSRLELYERSGHMEKFREELFFIESREGHRFALKPMNCPHHIELFRRKRWSYRELPIRYATTTKIYRDEQSGELSGLVRVRSITQDDAHIFCRDQHLQSEITNILDIVRTFYQTFGFTQRLRLSKHDPKEMQKYLGDETTWRAAEEALHSIVSSQGLPTEEAVGEAALYGPKIDFLALDSLGREWQVATIQLDLNLPERFDLNCTNERGEPERLVIIHTAIMGSLERFIAVLIEHYAGAFPLWLAPVQALVIPITAAELPYTSKVEEKLRLSGVRAELDSRNETLNKKIREWRIAKIPYALVIGEREVKEKTVTIEQRERGNLGTEPLSVLIQNLKTEIGVRRPTSA